MSKLNNFIWYEKYRPESLMEMSLLPATKKALSSFIEQKEIPHLMLVGPQGSGKTTVAVILLNTLPCNYMILNASSTDRGIETIKTKVKNFASSMPPKGKKNIIFMDEADHLTKDAQAALRNTMETYSSNCRFILTCNYPDKIIGPIHSRCIKFVFDAFPKKRLKRLIETILATEKITDIDDSAITKIIDTFYPDIRSVINNLQASCIGGAFSAGSIGLQAEFAIKIIEFIEAGKVRALREIYTKQTDFTWIYKVLFNHFQTIEAVSIIAEYLYRDNTVADREINMTACSIELMKKANFNE